MAAVTLMQKAKARMLIKHVFFATLVMSTEIKEDRSTPTAWTDMIRIGYNPDFLESLGDTEIVLFVLAHEVMHIVFKHGLRRHGRNPTRWNIACDFAINLILKKSGFKLWEHCLCDDRFDGMSAEQIYELREKEREERIKNGEKAPKTFGPGKPGVGAPDNGCDAGDMDDLREPGNMDAAEQAKVEQAIQQRVAQAASMARMAGKMPGELERLCNSILNPEVPWYDLFREYMTRVVHDDETWQRRNRRISDFVFPSKHSEAMGEVILIGDTSGSVHGNKDYYERIGGELTGIALQTRPERTRVIWADDSECSLQEIFEEGQEIVLHPKGGGGTDMRKPLQFVEQYNPMIVVLVTDGYTPWPESTPYPLIILCTTDVECPIGDVIRIK